MHLSLLQPTIRLAGLALAQASRQANTSDFEHGKSNFINFKYVNVQVMIICEKNQ